MAKVEWSMQEACLSLCLVSAAPASRVHQESTVSDLFCPIFWLHGAWYIGIHSAYLSVHACTFVLFS